MNKDDKIKLKELLIIWLNNVMPDEDDYKGFWSENEIARLLKDKLKERKHWKNRRRGKVNMSINKAAKVTESPIAKIIKEYNPLL